MFKWELPYPKFQVKKKTSHVSYEEPFFIKRWSENYFSIADNGNIIVKPNRKGKGGDLYELTKSLVEQGIEPPILIRFNGIIRDRINVIHSAFQKAIQEFKYRGRHQMAYPIKVNPGRSVVEAVQEAGKENNISLEVGSKPELIAVLTLDCQPGTLLLCNGYKDAEYISLALMARKLGKRPIIIIEQPYELKLVLDIANSLGLEAEIGLRMKLSHKGSGRWQSSSGEHAKFGLFSYEIVECIEKLKAEGKTTWLKLLHFHIGSQLTTIESIKSALNEGSRMYTEIAKGCPSLSYFDVGGGLAVDYDGSRSKTDSSMNYSVDEYARNIISIIGDACSDAGINDPTIITESGRATVSHHSVLIVEVIDVTSPANVNVDLNFTPTHPTLEILLNMHNEVNTENCREIFHDALELKEKILGEFVLGEFSLNDRALAEKLYRSLIVKIQEYCRQLPEAPEELEMIDKYLQEIYFCNFSVFQSLPDSWAIEQLFPVIPIHRLNEPFGHQAILADLSCDSDGKINRFIGRKNPINYLNLHHYNGSPYYLGIFLVGAYQEILGGLHNLFGDTNVVHAELSENGKWELSKLVEGNTIEEVLQYVQYNSDKLLEQLHVLIEQSLKSGRLTPAESAQVKKKFKQALESYTYLVI